MFYPNICFLFIHFPECTPAISRKNYCLDLHENFSENVPLNKEGPAEVICILIQLTGSGSKNC